MKLIIPSRALIAVFAAGLLIVTAACSSSSADTSSPAPAGSGATDASASGGMSAPAPAPSDAPWTTPAAAPSSGTQDAGSADLIARQEALRQKQQDLANHFIAAGKRHLDEGRLREARASFASALEVSPANAEAQSYYARISALMGEPDMGARAETQDTFAIRQAMTTQAYTLAKDYLDRARALFTQGEYARAVEEYRHALLVLQANPNLGGDFNVDQVKQGLSEAERKRDESAREAEAARLREVEQINRERDEAERTKAQRRIGRLWEQALGAFEQERFEECEKLCGDILAEDYTHAHAGQLKEAARRARHEKANASNIEEYRYQWLRVLDEIKSLAVPQTSDVVFADRKTWERISARGPLEFSRGRVQESEEDARVRQTLEATSLGSLDWSDKTLDDAVKFIRNNTGVNIIVAKAADEAVPPEERQLTGIKLEEVTALTALNIAVGHIANLAWVIEDGMVKITTKEQVRKRKVVEFYETRDLTAKLNNFPGQEINLNPSGFGAGTAEEAAEEGEELRTIEADRLIELVRQTVDPSSWDEDPENTIVNNNGTFVVRQTPENQRKIRQLLADLRKSAGIQVSIESRFVSVENNFLQDIGVDLRGLGDNTGGIGTAGLGSSRPFDDFGLPGSPTVLGTDNSSGAYYNIGGGNGDIRGRTQNLFDSALGNPSVLTSSGGFSLQYTYLDDTQLEAILRATQKYERVTTVTAPNLLVHNTQRANLQVTNHIAYVKDFDVEIAQASTIADPVVDVVKEGVVLDVRPIVSNDRRFVTLELRPSVATLVRPLRVYRTTLGGGSSVSFEVPELQKQSLKTTVVMPDGGTLLIGGLKFYEEQDQVSGIPVLKDIPILSFIFSRRGKYTNMRDLIVLLRVKIVIMEELEPNAVTSVGR